ncbi:MAG: hypothetical protein PHF56_19205 [Desulfuromonadaceae bacterium]|nr:hypothetical protein [Desulfuromonadaceae bacterium]
MHRYPWDAEVLLYLADDFLYCRYQLRVHGVDVIIRYELWGGWCLLRQPLCVFPIGLRYTRIRYLRPALVLCDLDDCSALEVTGAGVYRALLFVVVEQVHLALAD